MSSGTSTYPISKEQDVIFPGCVDAINKHLSALAMPNAALPGWFVGRNCALPIEMRSAQSKRVVKRLVNALLDARYDFEGEHKRWFTFGVPRAWDLLGALKALADHGYVHDVRFAPLLKLILDRQDNQGRWPLLC